MFTTPKMRYIAEQMERIASVAEAQGRDFFLTDEETNELNRLNALYAEEKRKAGL